MRILAVLLAAGGGTRFHGSRHKLDALLPSGHTVYAQSLGHLLDSGVGAPTGHQPGSVVVVHGGTERPVPPGIVSLRNPHWADGQATSVALALGLAVDLDVDAVLIGLADQPFVTPAAWRAVASAPPEWPIVVATYAGVRGPHPVRLQRSVWPSVPTIGDDGARNVLRQHAALVHEVPCDGSAADIDTLEDLERWTNS